MSDDPSGAQLVLNQLRASLDGSRYSLKAIYAAIGISFGGAVVFLALVLMIWHQLREVYAAKPLFKKWIDFFKRFYFSKPDLSKVENPFSDKAYPIEDDSGVEKSVRLKECVKETWTSKEDEVLAKQGLDATVYLRALRMNRNIFGLLTLLLFCTAAPINIVFNLERPFVTNLTHRDSLLLITPSLLSEHQMIPHVVLGWVSNLVVFAVLWYNYSKVLALRRRVLMSPQFQSNISNRTVMVTDLPRKLRSRTVLSQALSGLNPMNAIPENVFLGQTPSAELTNLITQHGELVKKYEGLCGCRHKHMASSDAQAYVSSRARKPEAVRLQKELFKLEKTITGKRSFYVGTGLNSYAFASFNSVRLAHSTVRPTSRHGSAMQPPSDSYSAAGGAQSLRSCGLRIAPPPEQIVWDNLKLTPAERGSKQLVVNALYGVLLLFWIVPSAFIGCFISNLSRLANVWPAFGGAMAEHPTLFAILQGFLSPSITTLVFAFLPLLFRKMSHLQGKITRIEREQEVLRKLYAFFFLDNFFVFTLIGVVWDVVAQVLQQTHAAKAAGEQLTFHEVWVTLNVAQRIATAIVNISSFWVMYILRGIIGLFGGSAQPLTLIKRFFRLVSGNKNKQTPRQLAEGTMPEPFQYAVNYLSLLFYTTVALGFTTIQPLVLPVTFILYVLSLPIKKYELCHMQVTKYESHGAFYPLVNDIVLFAAAFGNLMLFCVVWVQAGWKIATACAPLAVTVVVFKIITWFKFDKPFFLVGLELPESKMMSEDDERALLSSEYSSDVGALSSAGPPANLASYEDPQMSAQLDKPLLTFGQAVLHYAKKNSGSSMEANYNTSIIGADAAHYAGSLEKEPRATVQGSPFEDPSNDDEFSDSKSVEDVQDSEGHEYPSGYTPVEPYPAYRVPYNTCSHGDDEGPSYIAPYEEYNGAGLR